MPVSKLLSNGKYNTKITIAAQKNDLFFMPFNMNKKHFATGPECTESTTDSRRQRIRPKCSATTRNTLNTQPKTPFSYQSARTAHSASCNLPNGYPPGKQTPALTCLYHKAGKLKIKVIPIQPLSIRKFYLNLHRSNRFLLNRIGKAI